MDMKPFGELMDDLGFKKDSSFETKKAFLKHLFKEAQLSEEKQKAVKKEEPIQLSLFKTDKAA